MTIDEIKKELPTVKVKIKVGKKDMVVRGRVTGSKLDYPYVVIPTHGIHYPVKLPFQKYEFSWNAIERAINNDTYLTV